MAEVGCLKDGCFQNLQVEGTSTIAGTLLFKRKIISGITATQAFAASDSGSVIVLDDVDAACTLPPAEAGLDFTFVCGGIMSGFTLTCASGDAFAGTIKVTSTTNDKTSSDEVIALDGTVADSDVMTLNGGAATSGGQPGDTLRVVALDDTRWLVSGVLTTSNGTPGSLNIFS